MLAQKAYGSSKTGTETMMDMNIKSSSKGSIFTKYEDLLQKIKHDTDNLLHIARAGFVDQVIVDRRLLDNIADTLDYIILSADSTLDTSIINACSVRDNRDALTKILKKKTIADGYF